jgi:hypothetical protein
LLERHAPGDALDRWMQRCVNSIVAFVSGTGLHSSLRGLYASPAAPLPFLGGVVVRSFLLERAQGNVVIYHSPGITKAAGEILALGWPGRLLVNHWHEAMYAALKLDVPIFVHERMLS